MAAFDHICPKTNQLCDCGGACPDCKNLKSKQFIQIFGDEIRQTLDEIKSELMERKFPDLVALTDQTIKNLKG